jgi:hypothetical protein
MDDFGYNPADLSTTWESDFQWPIDNEHTASPCMESELNIDLLDAYLALAHNNLAANGVGFAPETNKQNAASATSYQPDNNMITDNVQSIPMTLSMHPYCSAPPAVYAGLGLTQHHLVHGSLTSEPDFNNDAMATAPSCMAGASCAASILPGKQCLHIPSVPFWVLLLSRPAQYD